MITLPPVALIRQTFDPDCITDINASLQAELERNDLRRHIESGQTVAITSGSRGISNIATVTREIVDYVKSIGAAPFIVPSMGSHGGATAEGQTRVLANLGIDESSMGCDIRSSMEVAEISRTSDGVPVFADRHILSADHVIVVNRVKPHTKFDGEIESGLMKMIAIGAGNHKGATCCHKAALQYGMEHIIRTVAGKALEKLPVLCGIGLVENSYDDLAIIRAFPSHQIFEREKELLVEARRKMATIPFDTIDLLIVDEIGKNISGTGMDPNVTGVNRDTLGTSNVKPETKRLIVRDLSPGTEGNAVGIGLADFTTTRLVRKIDRQKTYVNCLTAISPEKGAIPIYYDSDKECIDAALGCLAVESSPKLRLVHIRNTLSLELIAVSEAYVHEIEQNQRLELVTPWASLEFDAANNIISRFT